MNPARNFLREGQNFSSRFNPRADPGSTDHDDRPETSRLRSRKGPTMPATKPPRLRLFDPENHLATLAPRPKKVRLGEIMTVLAEAARHDRTWLSDFADDEVRISADLYEVLTTYRRLRPSA